MDIKFYMQEVDKNGSAIDGTLRDLEADFEGLRYCKAEGLLDIGKPRIYTETYADSNKVRTYIPDELTNEATTVTLTLYFVGDNALDTLTAFNEYLRHGYHEFWDTQRMLKFTFYVGSDIKISEEQYKSGTIYYEVKYTLNNIYGKTYKI